MRCPLFLLGKPKKSVLLLSILQELKVQMRFSKSSLDTMFLLLANLRCQDKAWHNLEVDSEI